MATVGPRDRRRAARAAVKVEQRSLDLSAMTADESFELLAARGRDRGRAYTLREVRSMAEEGLDFPAPGPAALAVMRKISARTAVRRELDLPVHSCAEEVSPCSCQSEAIDALLELEAAGGVVVD